MTKTVSTDGKTVILYDELVTGKEPVSGDWFFPEFWKSTGDIESTPGGRGSAWFVCSSVGRFVLRHYLRGGLPGKIIRDRYFWTGEESSRPFREWSMLETLVNAGLPVPRPVAARIERFGFPSYRGQIIVERLAGKPLSSLLNEDIDFLKWQEIGKVIAQLHRQNIWHADLNAHNILVHDSGVSLIDFDRAKKMSVRGRWCNKNIRRLRRSLTKLLGKTPEETRHVVGWQALVDAHAKVLRD
ncbi:MAG: 3-deoxy-D-manno-octulosonic acid kinase [Gammaproteobacteria bacterium]